MHSLKNSSRYVYEDFLYALAINGKSWIIKYLDNAIYCIFECAIEIFYLH